jgi:hypothetical protein
MRGDKLSKDEFSALCLIEFTKREEELVKNYGIGLGKDRVGYNQEKGTVSILREDNKIFVFNATLIGSCDSNGLWEWCWNNPNCSNKMRNQASVFRDLGEMIDNPLLTHPYILKVEDEPIFEVMGILITYYNALGVYIFSVNGLDTYWLLHSVKMIDQKGQADES